MSAGPVTVWRDAVLSHLKAAFPQVKDQAFHPGRFDDGEIGQELLAAPSFRLAVLGLRPADPVASGGVAATVKAAVFIVTRDAPGETRDAAALNLGAGVMAALDRFVPAAGGVFLSQPAGKLAFDILYSSKAKGVLLSAVSFETGLTIGRPFETEDGLAGLASLSAGGETLIPEGA